MNRRSVRVAVISTIPFTYSNRGDDILTQALMRMGCEVTHIACASDAYLKDFGNFLTPEDMKQVVLPLNRFGYIDKLMWWMPRSAGRIAIRRSIRGIKFDFNSFDAIVIGSGKPTFLLPLLPDHATVVYRQSDPMSMMFRGKCAHEMEKELILRADAILCVRKMGAGLPLYGIGEKKATIIENGFDIPEVVPAGDDLLARPGRKTAVYVGYTPVDEDLVSALSSGVPEIDFHLIGSCLSKRGQHALKQCNNVIYHGTMKPDDFLPIVARADIGIVPYAEGEYLKGIGLNSKYLMFMKMGLPIVSVPVGCQEEFPESDHLHFVSSADDFVACIRKELERPSRNCSYDIDFETYSKEGRIRAYIDFFTDLFKAHSLAI